MSTTAPASPNFWPQHRRATSARCRVHFPLAPRTAAPGAPARTPTPPSMAPKYVVTMLNTVLQVDRDCRRPQHGCHQAQGKGVFRCRGDQAGATTRAAAPPSTSPNVSCPTSRADFPLHPAIPVRSGELNGSPNPKTYVFAQPPSIGSTEVNRASVGLYDRAPRTTNPSPVSVTFASAPNAPKVARPGEASRALHLTATATPLSKGVKLAARDLHCNWPGRVERSLGHAQSLSHDRDPGERRPHSRSR